jgi:mannan endo-1,4-beta-mannosidase
MIMVSPESPSPPDVRSSRSPRRFGGFRRRAAAVVIVVCAVASAAVATVGVVEATKPVGSGPGTSGTPAVGAFSHHPVVITLPTRSASYLGAFVRGVPASYSPIDSFMKASDVRTNVDLYYSGWYEKFKPAFETQVAQHGAFPYIQIDPSGINLASIVAGLYDNYLDTFATDVAAYGAKTHRGIIIGFGHEMNGYWYSWGNRHTSPAVFVAAWRHIVNVFREEGAYDVTWLWTVNIIDNRGGIPDPAPWWPGDSYVTWVGIDGYYYKSSWTFASLFGPTIKAVRSLTLAPILVAETGAAPSAGQPRKITDLFAGIHSYGLLGFVWFDAHGVRDWRLRGTEAITSFRRGARTFQRLAS